MEECGGADRDRTCDLLIANETLYQLSYDPNQLKTGAFLLPTANLHAKMHAIITTADWQPQITSSSTSAGSTGFESRRHLSFSQTGAAGGGCKIRRGQGRSFLTDWAA